MTQPLDPYTLRQAAARWPSSTLNKRSAQSFLLTLAENAEPITAERLAQPATADPDPLREELRELVEMATSREKAPRERFPWISTDTIRALLEQYP